MRGAVDVVSGCLGREDVMRATLTVSRLCQKVEAGGAGGEDEDDGEDGEFGTRVGSGFGDGRFAVVCRDLGVVVGAQDARGGGEAAGVGGGGAGDEASGAALQEGHCGKRRVEVARGSSAGPLRGGTFD